MGSGGEKMTFSTKLKEEICQEEINSLEMRSELSAILRYDAHITNKITITFENGCVARRVFKDIKSIFNIRPSLFEPINNILNGFFNPSRDSLP